MNEQHEPTHTSNDNGITDQTISDALSERATRLADRSPAGIHDVYRRVDRHRQRRRSLAGMGAAAALLVGVGGLAIANQRSDAPAASPPVSTVLPATTALVEPVPVANSRVAWRCADPIDPPAGAPSDDASYFNQCEQVAIDVGIDPATALDDPSAGSPTTVQIAPEQPPTPSFPTDPSTTPPSGDASIPMTVPPDWIDSTSINEGVTYYVVQPGDSLASVADRFGRSADEVASTNDWDDGSQHVLAAGDVVRVSMTVTIIGPNLPPLPSSGPDPAIGQLAPAVLGSGFDGALVGVDPFISDQRPKLVVVAAHWCPHCDAALPALESLVDADRLPANLEIMAISSAEDPEMPNWPASEWFASKDWQFPTLVDAGEDGNVAAQALGVEGYPAMVLIGPDDVVLDRWVGDIGADEMANRINAAVS